jgi:hypothetical protein
MTKFCMLLARFVINGAVFPVINGKVQDLHHHGTILTQACRTPRGMQHFACTVLSSLAADENDCIHIERDGGIESLLHVMEAHPADAQLQQLVCQILGQLALHAESLRKMTSSNVLPQQLVSVLKMHGADANIACAACALLQTLALGPTFQAQLRSVGGVQELLRVAKLHRQDAALQQTVCGALVHLAADSDILAHVDDWAENLLGAMWAHPEVLPVQTVAAHGLARFVLHDGIIPKIKEGNGIDALLRAMAMHAGDAVLQEHLCSVLCRLASDPDCQWKIVAEGGLKHIIRAMDAVPLGASEMQARACAALHTLSSHPDNQIAIGTAGGIEVLVKVLAQHRDVGEMQFWGVMNLEQLARIPGNRVKILAANGIASIVRAMDAHRGDTELQYSACEVLRRLAETAEGQAQIVAAGGIPSIVVAMEAHSGAAALQVSACGALWTLAEESIGNAQSILEAGGADSLSGIMDIHVGNPEVQAQAARALWYLARQRPRSMARTDRRARNWKARRLEEAREREWALRANSGLPSVVTWYPRLRTGGGLQAALMPASRGFDDSIDSLLLAMATHKEPAVKYFSLCALGAIAAYDDDAAHAIIKSGGIAKIACAIAENENRAEMQWRGEEALWNLADADCREMAASAHFSSSSGRACALRLADGLGDVFHVMEEHRWVRNIQTFASWTLLTLATNEGRASAEVWECKAARAKATREGEAAAEEERNAANVKAAALAVAKSAAEMERAAAEAKAQATAEAAVSAAARELRAAAEARATAEAAAAAAARGESAAAAAREQAEHAVYSLTNRQERAAGCIQIGGVGGIVRILEALDCWDYHGDTEMLNGMLTCLQLLARNPDYAQQIAAAGGIERVLSLMDKYPEEPGILMAASLSLTTLAGHMEPDSSKPERFHPHGDLYVAHGDNAQKIRAEQGLEKIDALMRTCHEQHALHTEPPWNLLGQYGYLVKASVCQEDDADAECTAMGVRLTTA